MGLPARRIEHESKRPDLRVVERGARSRRSSSASRRAASRRAPSSRTAAQVAYCRARYRAFALVACAVTIVALGRVGLSAAAADVSLRSAELREQIKAARYEGDMLEVRKSALEAPGRVRAYADKRLDMAEARSVCYIRLDGTTECKPAAAPAKKRPVAAPAVDAAAPASTGLLARVMDVAAGEAQALLVGDVGIAATR